MQLFGTRKCFPKVQTDHKTCEQVKSALANMWELGLTPAGQLDDSPVSS